MNRSSFRLLGLLASIGIGASALPALAAGAPALLLPAPVAKTIPVTDDYFGTKIVDPYRWMEEPKSPDLAAYLKSESTRTRSILDAIPGRAKLLARLNSLVDTVTSSSSVERKGDRTFYERISPGSSLAKLYLRTGGLTGTDRVLLDPAMLTDGGKHLAIASFSPSDDGTLVAIRLTPDGNEPQTYATVYDVATGQPLPDRIERSAFGITGWRSDGKALYYTRLQDAEPGAPPTALYKNVRTYEHVLGAPQSADRAVFGSGVAPGITIAPNELAIAFVMPSTRFAIGSVVDGVRSEREAYIALRTDFEKGTPHWIKAVDFSDEVTGASLHGDDLYLLSKKGAPRFQVLKTSAIHPDIAHAQIVIANSARVIDSIATAKDALYIFERENGIARIAQMDFATGKTRDVPLPVQGTVSDSSVDPQYFGFVAKLEGWTTSPQWYVYDPSSGKLTNTNLDPPSPVDFSGITSDEVEVPGRDGTMIPLSIVHRKDFALDGSNPTLLYAYGSYGISSNPSFSAARLAWFERGGIYAIAHVRGGGENGEQWHLDGKDANKINTINDYVDCAKWLIDQNYTSASKLGGRGGSAGGITMGGAITRAPELFAAVLDEIPVSDQLRIEFSANGVPNIPEFGTVTTAEGFKNLYATSAVQHVMPGGKYPAVMVTTGANDPRVEPWQAAKMTATLQADSTSGRPILLRVDYAGGHGLIGATKAQGAELAADEYSFLLWNMGVADFQPKPE